MTKAPPNVLPPEHGARFVFERLDAAEDALVYRVVVVAPDAEHVYEAVIDRAAGSFTLRRPSSERPPWFDDFTHAFLKTIVANHKDEPPAAWPKRLVRWRQK